MNTHDEFTKVKSNVVAISISPQESSNMFTFPCCLTIFYKMDREYNAHVCSVGYRVPRTR